MFQDSEHKEEYHAPWCLQWIVAFCYTEYNNPLFYKQCMLSVLIFWHKKKNLKVFPSPILCHSWYWRQPSSPQVFPIFSMISMRVQLQLGEAFFTALQVKRNIRSYSVKLLIFPWKQPVFLIIQPWLIHLLSILFTALTFTFLVVPCT